MNENWHTLSAPSPNYNDAPVGGKLVVVHSTRGGASSSLLELQATLNWFAKPDTASAHLVIAFDGTIYRCVDDDKQAWHARELNAHSWGIELVQPFIENPFSPAQYASLNAALTHYHDNYGVPLTVVKEPALTGVTGHEFTAPGHRDGKTDPGPEFDWSKIGAPVEEPATSVELHTDGKQVIIVHDNVDIMLIGSMDGAFPGRLAKLFGDTYFWLRKTEDGHAYWSTEEGD